MSGKPPPPGRRAPPPKRRAPPTLPDNQTKMEHRDSSPSLPRSKTAGAAAPPRPARGPPSKRSRPPPTSAPKPPGRSPEQGPVASPAKQEFAASLSRALSHSATVEALGPSMSPDPPGSGGPITPATTILRPANSDEIIEDEMVLDDEEAIDGLGSSLSDSLPSSTKKSSTFRGRIFGGGSSSSSSSKRSSMGPSTMYHSKSAPRSKTERRGYSSMKLPKSLLGALHSSSHSPGFASVSEKQDSISSISEMSGADSLIYLERSQTAPRSMGSSSSASASSSHSTSFRHSHASKASTLSISVFRDTTLDAIKHSDYYYETSQIIEWFDMKKKRWQQGFVKETSDKGRFVSIEIGRDGVGGFKSIRIDLANEAYLIRHADSLPSVRSSADDEDSKIDSDPTVVDRDLVEFVRRKFRISPPPKIETNQSKITRMKRLLKRDVPPLPIFGIPLSKITQCERFSDAYECPIPTCLIFLTEKMDELFSWNLPSLFDAMISMDDPRSTDKGRGSGGSKMALPMQDTMERTKSAADKKKAILDESGARVLGSGTGVGIYQNMKVVKKPKVFKADIDELIFIIENSEEKTYKMDALFSSEYCGYLLAECLKIFFKRLGNPLLNELVNAGIGSSKWDHFREPKKKLAEKLALIKKLEKSVLYFLTDGVFLKLIENEDENEMSVERIARIWMPILLFGEIASELPGDETAQKLVIDWFSHFVRARETSLQWAS